MKRRRVSFVECVSVAVSASGVILGGRICVPPASEVGPAALSSTRKSLLRSFESVSTESETDSPGPADL
jgi:hypothetical protein